MQELDSRPIAAAILAAKARGVRVQVILEGNHLLEDPPRVKPLFAPQHGPEMEIMKQMLKAQSSVDFAVFTFAQSSGIDDTMIRLVGALSRLRGVLDRGRGAEKWAATKGLKTAGVQLFANKTATGVRKIHHKLMVIDERLVIAGSFNYTAHAHHPQRRKHHRARRPGRNQRRGRNRPTTTRRIRKGRNRPHHHQPLHTPLTRHATGTSA